MCNIRSSQVVAGILVFLLCAITVNSVSAADAPAPGDPITITGTDNTDAVYYPDGAGLTVQLQKDAALDVEGGDAAISLGPGGTVMMSAGSGVIQKKGASTAMYEEICGIALSGEKDNTATGVSHVVMEKEASVAVDGSAVDVDGSNAARVKGIGIDHSESARVSMTGAGITVTSALDNGFTKNFYAHGISVEDSDQAVITLHEGSQVNTDVSATGDSGRRYAWGLYSGDNETVNVQVLSESQINATAKVSDGARDGSAGVQAVGVAVFDATAQAVLSIDDAGVTAEASSASVGEKVMAVGVQVANVYEECGTATMHIEHGSQIDAKASGHEAFAVGGAIMTQYLGVVNDGGFAVTSGSRITTTATSIGTSQATAAAAALGTTGVKNVAISMDNARVMSTMQASAVNTGEGEAVACIAEEGEFGVIPGGIGAIGYESATVHLTDAHVGVVAEATASVTDGISTAMAGGINGEEVSIVSGLFMSGLSGATGGTAVALERSSIEVAAEATAEQSIALAAGIQLRQLGRETDLQLAGSTVNVSAQATATASVSIKSETDAGKATAVAAGVAVMGSEGDVTVSLDRSTVTASTTAAMESAVGVLAQGVGGTLDINLSNGSLVSASTTGGTSGTGMSYCSAILIDGEGTIHVDATSSLVGEWAVLAGPAGGTSAVTLNNSGQIKGRLSGVTLNNSSSGVLEASFDSEGTFVYQASPETDAFYFDTKTATLEDGTTFRIVPGENLGLVNPGDSREYALLQATEGASWNQDELKLEAVGNSPLLGLGWSGEHSDKLVADIKFLTPAEAGLSGNASEALNAAMADMPSSFVLGTDPEAWAPNVSGAFLVGMSQTLGASHANIGNRLGGVMGLNTGDEIVAANGLWFNAAFTDADQGERDGIAGFEADTTGLSIGYDRQAGPVTLGVACTIGKTDADADDGNASMDMTDHLFSLYGSYDAGSWFGEAVFSVGVGDVDSTRRLDAESFTASYDSNSYNGLVKVGMTLNRAGWQINPLLAVDYSYNKYDGYTEEGGMGSLDVDSQDYTVLNVGGGAALQRSWVKGWGILTPELSGMVRYDLKGDRIITTARFVGGSTAFVTHGADPAETSWELSAALTLASLEDNAVSLRLGYDYAGREDFNAHSLSGKIRYEF